MSTVTFVYPPQHKGFDYVVYRDNKDESGAIYLIAKATLAEPGFPGVRLERIRGNPRACRCEPILKVDVRETKTKGYFKGVYKAIHELPGIEPQEINDIKSSLAHFRSWYWAKQGRKTSIGLQKWVQRSVPLGIKKLFLGVEGEDREELKAIICNFVQRRGRKRGA